MSDILNINELTVIIATNFNGVLQDIIKPTSVDSKITIKCNKCSNLWSRKYNDVINKNKKCPICLRSSIRYSDDAIKQLLISKNMTLIEITKRYKRKCVIAKCNIDGYVFSTSINNLVNHNTACKMCKGLIKRTRDDMAKFIEEQNGTLISKSIVNGDTPIHIKCNECETEWHACFNDIRRGSWCPGCSTGKSEKMVKKIIEELSNLQFDKRHLKSFNKLELDGYNEEKKIAFEYQGKQHYQEVKHFHRTDDAFSKQVERDKIKRQLCIDNGIALIEIPYTYNHRGPIKLKKFIRKKLIEVYLSRNETFEDDLYKIELYKDNSILFTCKTCNEIDIVPQPELINIINNYPNCCVFDSCPKYCNYSVVD